MVGQSKDGTKIRNYERTSNNGGKQSLAAEDPKRSDQIFRLQPSSSQNVKMCEGITS